MKTIWRNALSAVFMGLIVPGILLNFGAFLVRQETSSAVQTKLGDVAGETICETISIQLKDSGEMDLEAYLVEVLLAEMPAYFEPEALKAQAVVARTYARKAFETGGKHGDGSVCREPGCCQGYFASEDYLASGGRVEDLDKIRRAVEATRGQVVTYDGKLIEATYFSCSGGKTEDAAAVWGRDFPYLQSVDSPGEENAAHYQDVVNFSRKEFANLLGISDVTGLRMGPVTYTEGGGVDTIRIGGNTYSGTDVRTLLNLRSTAFSMKDLGDTIEVTTKGYGHRVGMSQFGADAMAVSGSTYREILSHYYPGTELTYLNGKMQVS